MQLGHDLKTSTNPGGSGEPSRATRDRQTASRPQIRALLADLLVRDGYAVERVHPVQAGSEPTHVEDPDREPSLELPEWRE